MNRDELSKEQKKLVWRYVEVWRRFRRLPDGYRSFAELEEDLEQGSGMLLCGLLVEAQINTVITADVKDPKFHAAICGNDDNGVPDMTPEELEQARRYIIEGEGQAPAHWWWAKPPVPAAAGDKNGEPAPAPLTKCCLPDLNSMRRLGAGVPPRLPQA